MQNGVDLRVIKTKEQLVQAYLDTLYENTSSNVLDICHKADITAITYYKHFKNKNELIKYVIDQQLRHILPIPVKLKPTGIKQLLIYLIKQISTFFIKNKKMIINGLSIKNKESNKYTYIDCLNNSISFYAFNEINTFLNNEHLSNTITNIFIGGILNNNYTTISNSQYIGIDDMIEAFKFISNTFLFK